jgi:hypothetical protein
VGAFQAAPHRTRPPLRETMRSRLTPKGLVSEAELVVEDLREVLRVSCRAWKA